jgi:phosphatidylserine/phosphatidylglycerophosphate/cardiolipin synthase-like enzyme
VKKGRPLKWNELLELTGLDSEALRKALAELFNYEQIEKIKDGEYKVCHELYEEYSEFLKKQNVPDEPKVSKAIRSFPKKSFDNRKNDLINWINQWKGVEKIDISPEHGHFFLEGRHLDAFSKGLIADAKREVLVVNPFIEKCDLSDTLREARKQGLEVKVLTRPPDDKNEQYRQKRMKYHSTLKDEGIKLFYNQETHAKLIVVDRSAAVASSMNFYSGSSAGKSWEAGLISIEDTVVTSVVNAILELLKKPESKELK